MVTDLRRAVRVTEVVWPASQRLPHSVYDEARVTVLLGGSLRARCEHGECSCVAGSVIVTPAQKGHATQIDARGARCLHIELGGPWVERVHVHEPLFATSRHLRRRSVVPIALRLATEVNSADGPSPLGFEGLILELLGELCRPESRRSEPPYLRRVRDLLRNGYSQRPSLFELAEVARIHPNHLTRMFRRTYGYSIGQYVLKLRVEAAQALLEAGDHTLAEIANQTGFYDQSHFSTVFKKRTGFTPAKFRAASRARASAIDTKKLDPSKT